MVEPFVAVAGAVIVTARSADLVDAPATVTVNGPAVASGLTPFAAPTEYENYVVPAGGVPETAPVAGAMESHDGAPCASANVGAGTPLAANV